MGGMSPLAVHILLKLRIFMKKTKIVNENLQVTYNLLLKYCSWQCPLLPSTWAKTRNFAPKCKILNVF